MLLFIMEAHEQRNSIENKATIVDVISFMFITLLFFLEEYFEK